MVCVCNNFHTPFAAYTSPFPPPLPGDIPPLVCAVCDETTQKTTTNTLHQLGTALATTNNPHMLATILEHMGASRDDNTVVHVHGALLPLLRAAGVLVRQPPCAAVATRMAVVLLKHVRSFAPLAAHGEEDQGEVVQVLRYVVHDELMRCREMPSHTHTHTIHAHRAALACFPCPPLDPTTTTQHHHSGITAATPCTAAEQDLLATEAMRQVGGAVWLGVD